MTEARPEEAMALASESHSHGLASSENRNPNPRPLPGCRGGSNNNNRKRLARKIRTPQSNSGSANSGFGLGLGLEFRVRRSFLVARRGGPSTPAPSWKVYDHSQQKQQYGRLHLPCQVDGVSARKLAASLWELQGMPFSRTEYSVSGTGHSLIHDSKQHQAESTELHHKKGLSLHGGPSSAGGHGSNRQHHPHRHHHRHSESLPHFGAGIKHEHQQHENNGQHENLQHCTNHSRTENLQQHFVGRTENLQQKFVRGNAHDHQQHESFTRLENLDKLKGLTLYSQNLSPAVADKEQKRKCRDGNADDQQTHPAHPHKDKIEQLLSVTAAEVDADHLALVSAPTAQSELLKLINHICQLEEKHAASMSLVCALQGELDQTHSQLKDLLKNEKAHLKEIENTKKQILKERIMWREQHEEIVNLAIQSVRKDLDYERKSKEKLEILHRRLARDLKHVKKNLRKCLQDLHREREARESVEEVCDELARKISEDKERVEQLMHESAKVREEVEEERKMLQVAEIWREERVQMKLMEAKLELEEKNEALDRLRSEMEACMKAKTTIQAKEEGRIPQDPPRHSLDGRTSFDYFHTNGNRALVSGRKSIDSVCGFQVLKSNGWRGGANEGYVNSQDEPSSKYGGSQEARSSFQQPIAEKTLMYKRGSTEEKPKKLSGRSHGLNWLLNRKNELGRRGELKERRDEPWSQKQDPQWIAQSTDGNGMAEQRYTNGGGTNEARQSAHKMVLQFPENIPKTGGGNSQHVISATNVHMRPVLDPMFQRSDKISSPTQPWRHCEISTDPGSITSDNSLKAKLLEAKLEDQQSLLKSEKSN